MKRIAICLAAWLYVVTASLFAFWIGGGEFFTLGAGLLVGISFAAATILTCVLSGVLK